MDFFCKLLPPRVNFAQSMTEAEGQLMRAHAAYWTEWIAQGRVVVFGLVGDPRGAYGMGIVRCDDEAAARTFTDRDPVIEAQAGFEYEIHLMPLGATRG